MGIEHKDLVRSYTPESIEKARKLLELSGRRYPTAEEIAWLIVGQVYPGGGFAEEVRGKTGGGITEAEVLGRQLDEQGATPYRFRHEVGMADEFLRRAHEAVRAGNDDAATYWYKEHDRVIDQAHRALTPFWD